jgi:probable F420-dependent oxidoreductase
MTSGGRPLATGFSLTGITDPGELRDTAQALDEAGVGFVSVSGHILTAAEGRYPDRPTPSYAGIYRDPFVLFSFLAATTSRLRFRTAILILPLYPAPLVARQAADLAAVSGGRFELGVGISWQQAEYAALGQQMRGRGERMEEQIAVLRAFWGGSLVSMHGRFHEVDRLGIGEQPPVIPVFIGCGSAGTLLGRVARVADGWLPLGGISEAGPIERLRTLTAEAGRDPAVMRVGSRLTVGQNGPEPWLAGARAQQQIGVTDLTLQAPPGSSRAEALSAVLAAHAVITTGTAASPG